MASGEALVIASVLAWETGFVMTEQLPCLKLNDCSITPENDVATCLYERSDERYFEVPLATEEALPQGV
jgi:hypothetical protein